jgi:hypothetical protein
MTKKKLVALAAAALLVVGIVGATFAFASIRVGKQIRVACDVPRGVTVLTRQGDEQILAIDNGCTAADSTDLPDNVTIMHLADQGLVVYLLHDSAKWNQINDFATAEDYLSKAAA